MESFENKLIVVERTLENIRGIFDKEDIKKLTELEKNLLKENF